jgi:hypothetical protein
MRYPVAALGYFGGNPLQRAAGMTRSPPHVLPRREEVRPTGATGHVGIVLAGQYASTSARSGQA